MLKRASRTSASSHTCEECSGSNPGHCCALGRIEPCLLIRLDHYNVLILVAGEMTVRCRYSWSILSLGVCMVTHAFAQYCRRTFASYCWEQPADRVRLSTKPASARSSRPATNVFSSMPGAASCSV
jgi:hypothetical protein